jgi:hypothetical protein
MIVTTADLYTIAYGKYAIGAYNLNNLEQTLGLFKGCLESQAPFITNCRKALGNTPTKGCWKSSFEKSRRYSSVHREFFPDHPEQFDFRPPGTTFVEEYAKFSARKNETLGLAGQLSLIRPFFNERTQPVIAVDLKVGALV